MSGNEASTKETDLRRDVWQLLQKHGYTPTSSGTDISDPFTWNVVATKGEYEITITEKCRSR
jgi:hypothetical protein